MLEKIEVAIKNGQSRDTGNIGYTKHIPNEPPSVTEIRRTNDFFLILYFAGDTQLF
jgi:hypothetical protein